MGFKLNPITGQLDLVGSGSSYTLPTASGSTLGGVKVGTRLSIDGNGVLSADVQSGGGDMLASVYDPAGGARQVAFADEIPTDTDELVKLSASDPTAGYLDAKLQEGIQAIQFDTTDDAPITNAEGLLQWNATDGTIDLGMSGGDITMQIGQELFTKVRNPSGGSTITNGMAVYISGRTGVFPDISLAKGDAEATSRVLGVTTQDIASPGYGYVTTTGYVRGIKTDYTGTGIWGTTWVTGDLLYLSKSNAGVLTNVEPDSPHHSDVIGSVGVISTAQGSILITLDRHRQLSELSDVNGTALTEEGQLPVWNEPENVFDFNYNINNYRTYSGFENRTDSTISINSGTGVFTLAKVSDPFNVYTNGTGKHVISDPQTVTVTDDQTITYIYIDSAGTLQKSTLPWNLDSGENAPCAIVFKDGTTYAVTDERHSYARNAQWHTWAHFNIGAMYRSGLVGTFDDTTLSVTQGVMADEDIDFDTLETKTTASLWYRNATTGMRLIRNSTTPYRAVTGVLQYDNGSGTLQPVDNSKFVNSWVYASNDPTEPIYIVIGQNQYTTQNLALADGTPTINLSTAEWKLLYKVIYQNDNGAPDYKQTVDYRTVQTGVPTTSVSPTSHTSLTDRDVANSHPISAITDLQTTLDAKQLARSIATISTDTTAGAVAKTDYIYFVTGTTTLTMPTAVGNTNRYTVKSISGTTTIACNGAETIDGTATIGIANEDSVDLASNNSEWKVI